MSLIETYAGGRVRYFTYYIEFPDGEVWHRQKPFTGKIEDEVMYTPLRFKPEFARKLVKEGAVKLPSPDGLTKQWIKVEDFPKADVWGVRRKRK